MRGYFSSQPCDGYVMTEHQNISHVVYQWSNMYLYGTVIHWYSLIKLQTKLSVFTNTIISKSWVTMGSTVIDQFQYVTLIVLYIYVHMVTYVYYILLFHLQVLLHHWKLQVIINLIWILCKKMKIGDFTFLNKEYHLIDMLVEIYKYWIDDMARISIIQQHICDTVSLNQVGDDGNIKVTIRRYQTNRLCLTNT